MIAISSVTGKEEPVVMLKGVTYDDLDAWLTQTVVCPWCKGKGSGDFVTEHIDGAWFCEECAGTGHLTLKALIEMLEVYDAHTR